jgi:uncharacterized protein involved in exopolysaccharide biosynthesis
MPFRAPKLGEADVKLMNVAESDLSLADAIHRIVKNKWRVLACVAVGVIAGILVAVLSRRVYVGEVVVVPQSASSGGKTESVAKRLSGLASIAGISVGGEGGENRDIAIATLTSYQTISTFLGSEGIQQKVLDEVSRGWPEALFARRRPSTTWEAVRAFREHMLLVPDKDSSLVRLSIDWYDPISASRWANGLVALADAQLRSVALSTARGRLNYLQKELENNPVVAVREVVSGMMEENLRTLATAGADREFAFRVIDPAVAAERAVRPKRLLIVVAFGSAGLLFGILAAIFVVRPR